MTLLFFIYAIQFVATVVWLFLFARSLFSAHGDDLELEDWKEHCNVGNAAGVCSVQGRRPHMEDTYYATPTLDKSSQAAFYAVYDGHGGARASVYSARYLHRHLVQYNYESDGKGALTNAFLQTDQSWLKIASEKDWNDGSTAVAALIVNGVLHVANLGDSRAVLCSDGKAVPMSRDHKPDREDEKERVERLGGRIIYYGTWRVEGVLAVTRAIGDRKLKKWVSAMPEIETRKIGASDTLLIIATDGLWDVMSNQEACAFASQRSNLKEAAQFLVDTALRRGSVDNITALVVDLTQYR